MSEQAEIVSKEIYQLVLKHYPSISEYHALGSIQEMIGYFSKLNKVNEKDAILYWPTYREGCRVDDWNSIWKQIEKNILGKKIVLKWEGDDEKSEFDQGVYAAIRLIQHRVHCILD